MSGGGAWLGSPKAEPGVSKIEYLQPTSGDIDQIESLSTLYFIW